MHTDLNIHNELKELNSLLADFPNVNVFTVPDGYFENLAADVLYNVDHDQSINELSRSTSHMDIPQGYFDGLADTIMNKIRSEADDTISEEPGTSFIDTIKYSNIYPVPPGYFHSLSENIMSRIRSEVVDNIGEVPDTSFIDPVRNLDVYTVPAGYFNSLADNIINKLPQTAKVVSFKKHVSFSRYAVAAAITGILGLSLFTIFDKKRDNELVPQQSSLIMAEASLILKTNNFDKVFETLADEEIVSYLQDNGEDVKAALVASVTDENTLPNEEDYYIDEKTLDNFLNDQHIIQTRNN